MAEHTLIEWCHHTWNAWRGCTKVSAGCTNCYAEAGSGRNPKLLGYWGPMGPRVLGADSYWLKPHTWNRRSRKTGVRESVFSLSLGDVFDEWPGQVIGHDGRKKWINARGDWMSADVRPSPKSFPLRLADVRMRFFDTIRLCPDLDWLLVTKRPDNILPAIWGAMASVDGDCHRYDETLAWLADWLMGKPPANVMGLVSVEDQEAAEDRIPKLLKAPFARRGLSMEPLLGPVDLKDRWLRIASEGQYLNVVECGHAPESQHLNWVIVGGESGPKARPCNIQWVMDLVDQCTAAGVPVFVKQLGKRAYDSQRRISIDSEGSHAVELGLRDTHGGDWSEWPNELRVRLFYAPMEVSHVQA